MSEQSTETGETTVRTTSVVDVGGGVAIDLAQVPSNGEPRSAQGSHLRSTGGRGYQVEDDETGEPVTVARADIIVGPHPDAS
jgi:hypothetical protein